MRSSWKQKETQNVVSSRLGGGGTPQKFCGYRATLIQRCELHILFHTLNLTLRF